MSNDELYSQGGWPPFDDFLAHLCSLLKTFIHASTLLHLVLKGEKYINNNDDNNHTIPMTKFMIFKVEIMIMLLIKVRTTTTNDVVLLLSLV